MSTPTVNVSVTLPLGAPAGCKLRVHGVFSDDDEDGPTAWATTVGGDVIFATSTASLASDGTGQLVGLHPNTGSSDDAIADPSGSTYVATLHLPGGKPISQPIYFTVADVAGPVDLGSVDAPITNAPGSVGGGPDVLIYQGTLDCSAYPDYPAADAGHLYRISAAGLIGGETAGLEVRAGDLILCTVDDTGTGNQATVGSSWLRLPNSASVAPRHARGCRVAVTGTSITHGVTRVTTYGLACDSPADRMTMKLGRRCQRVANAGHSGAASFTIAAEFDANVLAYNPDAIIIEVGANDGNWATALSGTYLNDDDFELWTGASIRQMTEKAIAAGAFVMLAGPIPYSDSIESANTWQAVLEAGQRKIANEYGIPFVSLYGLMADPATGFGNGTLMDTPHPNAAGAEILGAAMAEVLARHLDGPPAWRARYDDDPATDVLVAALWSSGDTGGVPTNWTAYGGGGGTLSLVDPDPGEDLNGKWFKIDRTSGTLGIKRSYTFTPGDTVELVCDVKVTDAAAGMELHVEVYDGTDVIFDLIDDNMAGLDYAGAASGAFVVPAGTSSVDVRVYVTGGNGTSYVGELTARTAA